MTDIFSCGGGTQSAAIAALIVRGDIPKPAFCCIVDTERERETTWQYLDAVIRPVLTKAGVEVHRIRISEWATNPSYFSKDKSTILIPAFTDLIPLKVGKLSGFCSNKWKVETQTRYTRIRLGVPTNEQRRWIGFSLDEAIRASRMMNSDEYKSGLIWFPLIQGVPTKRKDAIRMVEKMGWPTPPRSACWMCPNQTNNEWLDLKINHPDEFAKACELEKELQKTDPNIWFHKECVPLAQATLSTDDETQLKLQCSSGVCFV